MQSGALRRVNAGQICRGHNSARKDKRMIKTDRVIDYYTDVFGNEQVIYASMERYTVWYEGYIFEGDTDGFNEHNYDRWEDAISLYNAYGDMIHIRDNEYGVSFDYGEWS